MTDLQRKVEAQNAANAALDEMEPLLREGIQKFTGQKIYKVSGYGGFTAKVKRWFDAFIEKQGCNVNTDLFSIHCYEKCAVNEFREFTSPDYKHRVSIYFKFRAGNTYIDESIWLCTVDNEGTMLDDEFSSEWPRKQYVLEEVVETKAEIRKLEEQIRELRSGIYIFEHIR